MVHMVQKRQGVIEGNELDGKNVMRLTAIIVIYWLACSASFSWLLALDIVKNIVQMLQWQEMEMIASEVHTTGNEYQKCIALDPMNYAYD